MHGMAPAFLNQLIPISDCQVIIVCSRRIQFSCSSRHTVWQPSAVARFLLHHPLSGIVYQRSRITDARPLLQSLHSLPIRERILYKTALLTFKTRLAIPGRSATTSTTDKIAAVLRRSTVDCTTNTNCTGGTRFLCGCAHCLERFTVQRPVVRLALYFQKPSENSLFYRRVCVTYTSASVSSVVTSLYKYYYHYYCCC